MKVYRMLEEMTFADAEINGVRSSLEAGAAKLPASDSFGARLRASASEVDAFRMKIVATKEGGMITGEERLREYGADLYGSLNGYEGRPTQTELERAGSLNAELSAVEKDFHAWTDAHIAGINAELKGKLLTPIGVLSREDWEKQTSRK